MNRITAAALAAQVIGEPVTITARQATDTPTVWRALQAGTGVHIEGMGQARPRQFGPGYVLAFHTGDVYPANDNADAAAAITAHARHLATINN